ncbi:hypothetical protein CR513_00037, partial [Mucuna pruriens]
MPYLDLQTSKLDNLGSPRKLRRRYKTFLHIVKPMSACVHIFKLILENHNRYLKGTTNLGLCFKKSDKYRLVGYKDSNYARDRIERKASVEVATSLEPT